MRHPSDYIIFPLDVASRGEAQKLVGLLAGQVGMFKIGLELFVRSGPDLIVDDGDMVINANVTATMTTGGSRIGNELGMRIGTGADDDGIDIFVVENGLRILSN